MGQSDSRKEGKTTMDGKRKLLISGALLLVFFGIVGCGQKKNNAAAKAAARQVEWKALEAAKQELDQKRTELADLRAKSGAAESGETAGGEDAGALKAQVEQLSSAVDKQVDDFNTRLASYINDAGIVVGEPMTEDQAAALRMKSSEDMTLARDYIDRGGEFSRAIDIYQAALKVDPDNQALKDALAKATADRYMTQERFAQAKKGMTDREVRATLGQPNLRNVRAYSERGVVAWFYPKDEHGAAAGVFFQKKGKGDQLVVYKLDFDAVKTNLQAPAGG